MTEVAHPPYQRWGPLVVVANVVSPIAFVGIVVLYFMGYFEPEPIPLDSPVAILDVENSRKSFVFDLGPNWLRMAGAEKQAAAASILRQGEAVSDELGSGGFELPRNLEVYRQQDSATLMAMHIKTPMSVREAGRDTSYRAEALESAGFEIFRDEYVSFDNKACYLTDVRREQLVIQSANCKLDAEPRFLVSMGLMQTAGAANPLQLADIAESLRFEQP